MIRFYSEADHNYLLPAIEGKVKLSQEFVEKAAKKLKRTPASIRQYVYNRRDKTGGEDPTINRSSFKQGEFIIPISKWEIKTRNGVTQLIFKFGKNVK